MRTSIYRKSKSASALTSTTIAVNGTTNGSTIDLLQAGAGDFRTVLFVALSGTLTDGTYTLGVEHSGDVSTWSVAAATDGAQGSGSFAATDDNAVREVGYAGTKRYCRVKVTAAGVTTGGTLSAVAVLYDTAGFQR